MNAGHRAMLVILAALMMWSSAATAQRRAAVPTRSSPETALVRGRVVGLKAVRLRASDQANLVVLVQARDGMRWLVDLGSHDAARELDLQLGDPLLARGSRVRVRGRVLLVAVHARSDDLFLTIDRTEQRRHFQRAMARAQGWVKACPIAR